MFTGGEKKSVAITCGTWKSRVFCFQMLSDKAFKKIFKNIKIKPWTVPYFLSLTFRKIQRTLRSGYRYPSFQQQLQSVGFELRGGNLMNMRHVIECCGSGSGIHCLFYHIFESLVLFGLKISLSVSCRGSGSVFRFLSDPGIRIRDAGWEKSEPGIRDEHPRPIFRDGKIRDGKIRIRDPGINTPDPGNSCQIWNRWPMQARPIGRSPTRCTLPRKSSWTPWRSRRWKRSRYCTRIGCRESTWRAC